MIEALILLLATRSSIDEAILASALAFFARSFDSFVHVSRSNASFNSPSIGFICASDKTSIAQSIKLFVREETVSAPANFSHMSANTSSSSSIAQSTSTQPRRRAVSRRRARPRAQRRCHGRAIREITRMRTVSNASVRVIATRTSARLVNQDHRNGSANP